jgi:hypothetical protein
MMDGQVPTMLDMSYDSPTAIERLVESEPKTYFGQPVTPIDIQGTYTGKLQSRVGAKVDGMWGPNSAKSLENSLQSKEFNAAPVTAEEVIDKVIEASVPSMLQRPTSSKPLEEDNTSFKEALGNRESSGKYDAVNQLGYLGKYQFGGMALRDLGYQDKDYNWTGKDNINSKEDFLANSAIQEKSADTYFKIQEKYLDNNGALDYVGTDFKGFKVTKQGLIAASHLVGAGAVNTMLKTGIVPQDANGTKALEYLELGNTYSK